MTSDEMMEHDEMFRAESEANRERKTNGDTSPALTPDDMTAAETDEYNAGIAATVALLENAARLSLADPAVERYRELRKKYNFDAPKPAPVEPAWEDLYPTPAPDVYEWWGYKHDYRHGDALKPARNDRRLALLIVAELVRGMFIDPLESEFDDTIQYATSSVLRTLRSNPDLLTEDEIDHEFEDAETVTGGTK